MDAISNIYVEYSSLIDKSLHGGDRKEFLKCDSTMILKYNQKSELKSNTSLMENSTDDQ